jgi:hypothetical protein
VWIKFFPKEANYPTFGPPKVAKTPGLLNSALEAAFVSKTSLRFGGLLRKEQWVIALFFVKHLLAPKDRLFYNSCSGDAMNARKNSIKALAY